MNSAIERITGLRVKDLMNGNVLTVAESDTMQSAARKIFDKEVTGAPVVNAEGACVGMLSASDFVGQQAGRHVLEVASSTDRAEPYQIDCLNDDLVASHMSPTVQAVSGESTSLTAARLMCNDGIHRLVVIDAKKRPIGIVTTLDLVAALIAAVEE